ncbi:MAG: domain containing protein [Polaromonas sp.]|nr:domain containing protein [Polaromonas sp.]
MPKMIISLDSIVLKEVQLTKDRTSLGRRPYNDIVIDNMAVSGEHAVVQMSGNEAYIEDLNSTNGTYVNGKTVKKQLLQNDDVVEIGKYKIQYVNEAHQGKAAKTAASAAAIKVISGAAAGREMALIKPVTTLGKPGIAVAAITNRPGGFVIAHVEGHQLMLNGAAVGTEAIALKNGDMIELAGTKMQFVQH